MRQRVQLGSGSLDTTHEILWDPVTRSCRGSQGYPTGAEGMEGLAGGGECCSCWWHSAFLDSLVWRKSPFVRALFLAYEQGLEQGCALQMHLAKNLGDSRVVETAHSKCKDILRESKSNAPSLTAIQHQLLLSKSLEERNVNSITVNPADKVFASSSAFTSPVLLKMNPRSHKLPVSLQKMMAKQGVTNSWPSPSPASMFPIQAATEWLFSAWDAGLPAGSLEKAWVTLLAGKPGTIVAQKSTGVW